MRSRRKEEGEEEEERRRRRRRRRSSSSSSSRRRRRRKDLEPDLAQPPVTWKSFAINYFLELDNDGQQSHMTLL